MSNNIISQIRLPDGSLYDIAGEDVDIDSTYNSTSKTVTIILSEPGPSPAGVTITQDSTTGILTIV